MVGVKLAENAHEEKLAANQEAIFRETESMRKVRHLKRRKTAHLRALEDHPEVNFLLDLDVSYHQDWGICCRQNNSRIQLGF